MISSEPLDRTIRLIREYLVADVADRTILEALATTRIVISSDVANASTHSSQTAIVTAAMLMTRCGLDVWLDIPNAPLLGPQPPLRRNVLRDGLLDIGDELLPGAQMHSGRPAYASATVAIGDSSVRGYPSSLLLRLNATDWVGILGGDSMRWAGGSWPFGAMAVGAMAACEAFKLAIAKLRSYANDTDGFESMFQVADAYTVRLASESTPLVDDLHSVDIISAGAVSNAAMFALLRLPDVRGSFRVVEPQQYDRTNLNRCMLMLESAIEQNKAVDIVQFQTDAFHISAITRTFQEAASAGLAPLGSAVIVGVDDIPTRWDVQNMQPAWLGVGATSHWSAMASYHTVGRPCARCLHSRNDGDPVEAAPTISFVSFWAGLWVAAFLLQHLAGVSPTEQQVFLSPNNLYRPFGLWRSDVPWSKLCPSHSAAA